MLLLRIFRPLATHPVPLSTPFTRLALPVHTRSLTSSTIQPSEQSTSPEPLSSPSSESTVSPTSIATAPQSESQSQVQLPYFVGRNNLNNLSVYHKSKRGGNLELTYLKNGEGDLQALKQDIKEALQLKEGDVTVNSVTKHIVIRGRKKHQVLNFLRTVGF